MINLLDVLDVLDVLEFASGEEAICKNLFYYYCFSCFFAKKFREVFSFNTFINRIAYKERLCF